MLLLLLLKLLWVSLVGLQLLLLALSEWCLVRLLVRLQRKRRRGQVRHRVVAVAVALVGSVCRRGARQLAPQVRDLAC